MIPGIHVSTAGGIQKAPERLRALGLMAGQVFTANQRRWSSPAIPPETVEKFRAESGGLTFVSHASYLINPCSSRSEVREKSLTALVQEVRRCRALEIPFLVLHPGAYQEAGLTTGMKMVADSLRGILSDFDDGPMILLENTAGAGTSIGRTFPELAEIRELSGVPERVGFCIDTAHAHGAGYDLGASGFVEEMIGVLGRENLKAFHMNGSKAERGSHRDRHEHFNSGTLSETVLRDLFQNPALEDILGIAETPGTDEERAADIKTLTQ